MRSCPPVTTAFIAALLAFSARGQVPPAPPADAGAPFTLDLPVWSPDPESLPPELRPIDVIRPTLPPEAAVEMESLRARISMLDRSWPSDTDAQSARLDEAIAVAERMLAIRTEHQGNESGLVRWRDVDGEAATWHEITDAADYRDRLRLRRSLEGNDREAMRRAQTDARACKELLRSRDPDTLSRASTLLAGCLATYERLAGDASPLTIEARNNLAYVHAQTGRFDEAGELFQRSLEMAERHFGPEHPYTARTLVNLSELRERQGLIEAALSLQRAAVQRSRRARGDLHIETLGFTHRLIILYRRAARFEEAEMAARHALAIARSLMGDSDPKTLQTAFELANVLRLAGRPAESLALHDPVLEGREIALGPDHWQTLQSSFAVGHLLEKTGRPDEAVEMHRRTLDGFRATLGPSSPYTLRSISALGQALHAAGRLDEAEIYLRRAVTSIEEAGGAQHGDFVGATNNLAMLLRDLGRSTEAETFARQALELSRQIKGPEDPTTLLQMANLASVLRQQGRLAEAEPLCRQALELRRRQLGSDHVETLQSISNMALLLEDMDRFEEAKPLLRESMETAARLLGDDHPMTQVAMNNLAGLLWDEGRLEEAESLWRDAVHRMRRTRGEDHQWTIKSLTNLAVARRELGRFEDAERSYAMALDAADRLRVELIGGAVRRATFSGHIQLPSIARGHARTLIALGRARDALDSIERGRSRAALDLFLGDRAHAERALVETADAETRAAYREAVSAESNARAILFERETELASADVSQQAERRAALEHARVTLARRTADVYGLLRGLVPVARPLDAAAIIEALPSDEALLYYVWGGGSLNVLIIGEGDVRAVTLAEGDDAIAAVDDAVAALRSSITSRDPAARAELDRVIEAIARRVAPAEVMRALDGMKRVTVVTDGPLSELPLDLLLEGMPVVMAPSATIAIDRRRAARRSTPRDHVVAVGGSIFDAAPSRDTGELAIRSAPEVTATASALEQIRLYGGSLDRLPASRLEAEAVGALWGARGSVLVGADASVAELRGLIASEPPRLLHIATHGLLGNAEAPLLASLALTAPESPSLEDFGFLTLAEILTRWGGALDGTDLVVLSACNTARGVKKGDTTMSLPLGFFACGAETVVASLWRVDDLATALLMTRMHENLLGAFDDTRTAHTQTYEAGQEMTKLDALDEAKRWLRGLTVDEVHDAESRIDELIGEPTRLAEAFGDRGGIGDRPPTDARDRIADRPFAHPSYWAAFVLYGSPD